MERNILKIGRNSKIIGRDGNPIKEIPEFKPRQNPDGYVPFSEWIQWTECCKL